MLLYCLWNEDCRKCHSVRKGKKRNGRKSFAAGAVDVYRWIKFSNLWRKQLFQMSQYLLGANTFSHKTTFVNETNTFYHFINVDRSPRIWLWGPHKGSQAKLQYFSKRPLGFLPPYHYLNAFLKVFNLHPNVVPLFSLIYNADAEAISVMEVRPKMGRRGVKNKQNHFTFICPSYELSW